jgi:MSHA pilin protein MshA
VVLEGQTITLVNGYPSKADILLAAQIGAGDFDVSTTTSPATISAKSVADKTKCQVTYAEAAANGAPTIGINVSDCK